MIRLAPEPPDKALGQERLEQARYAVSNLSIPGIQNAASQFRDPRHLREQRLFPLRRARLDAETVCLDQCKQSIARKEANVVALLLGRVARQGTNPIGKMRNVRCR